MKKAAVGVIGQLPAMIATGNQAKEKKEWKKVQEKMKREEEQRIKKNEALATCFGNFGRLNRFAEIDRQFTKRCMNCPKENMCAAVTLGIQGIKHAQKKGSDLTQLPVKSCKVHIGHI